MRNGKIISLLSAGALLSAPFSFSTMAAEDNGFKAEEIEASPIKPKITVSRYEMKLEDAKANKTQIKEAVEKMFDGVRVASVNTINLDGKNRRRGVVTGKTAKSKKAIVQLTEDSKDIEIFSGL